MIKRFLAKKTHRFFFIDDTGKRKSYVLIFGDEVNTLPETAPSGDGWQKVTYRKRIGEMKKPRLSPTRSLEMYFLDVGQGDAAFIVTPGNKKILVDGGLRDRALGFLIWKYRLDQPDNRVIIDYLVLSHGDIDHVEGLIPILNHPQIEVKHIVHNGIAVFKSGFNTEIGHKTTDNLLTTLHSTTAELEGLELAGTFKKWIKAVEASGADYQAVETKTGSLEIGDPAVSMEILGPIVDHGSAGTYLPWFHDKAHTINGHSVVFRLCYNAVRTLFSGDLNIQGSRKLLGRDDVAAKLDAHIFKAPHHGSHEYYQPFFEMISPMVTVVSSGDSPDHGHPRAQFLGGIGLAGRSKKPLVFSTEIAATFKDFGSDPGENQSNIDTKSTLGDLDFSTSSANAIARHRFKKILPGIINVRTDGKMIYAFRRVQAGYQWESYGPLRPVAKNP